MFLAFIFSELLSARVALMSSGVADTLELAYTKHSVLTKLHTTKHNTTHTLTGFIF